MFRGITWRLRRRPPPSTCPVIPADTAPPPASREKAECSAHSGPPLDGPERHPALAGVDDRGSSRMLLAAAMLRRGDDIDRVAAISDVPAALLDLMSGELSGTDSNRRSTTGELRPGRRTRRASQRFIAAVAIEIAAAVNIAGCVVALLRHDAGLAVLTAVIAGSLTLAVTLLARLSPSSARVRAVQRPSATGRRDQG
jgi:hypothetical protein